MTWRRDAVRSAAGPVICAIVLIGVLSAWVSAGGAGTLTKVRLQVTLAAVPMRSFYARESDAVHSATTFLTIRNISAVPDALVAVRSPLARSVALRGGSFVIPAHGELTLTPFGSDVVLKDPSPYEALSYVPLVLTFRSAGTVTVDAAVTDPGTP
jgi:copper(I)-binding protein